MNLAHFPEQNCLCEYLHKDEALAVVNTVPQGHSLIAKLVNPMLYL